MIRAAALTASLLLIALPATAQSTFERLETLAVTMNQMMFDEMVARTPALEGNMPSAEWSDDLRAAYRCMFDAFQSESSPEAMDTMVTAMEVQLEALTPAEVLAGAAEVENPEGISDARADQIIGSCGMMEAFTAHIASSGALQILMEDG